MSRVSGPVVEAVVCNHATAVFLMRDGFARKYSRELYAINTYKRRVRAGGAKCDVTVVVVRLRKQVAA